MGYTGSVNKIQIEPREHLLLIDHAGYRAFIRQHELDHTDQKYIIYLIYLP